MYLLGRRESSAVVHDLLDGQHLEPLFGLDFGRLEVVVEVDSEAELATVLVLLGFDLLLGQGVSFVDVEVTFDTVFQLLEEG